MLRHVLTIVNEKYEDMKEYDLDMDIDTFSDMKDDIQSIIDEIIESI